MCSVIGFTKRSIPEEAAIEGFARSASRGPDMSFFREVGEGWLGFHRLAIMGLSPEGMQPFELGGSYLVCNGELYGFRPIKTELISMGYRFKSGSDCEILLPMYREYGTGMFAMLDAEFALILYDAATGSFIAARDPLGIRPLYYGELPEGGMAFASEPRNLVGICERIMPFPPGCWWKDGEFHRYCDLTTVEECSGDDEEAAARHIRELLIQAVDKRLDSDAPLGFLLSGGLDSSLVCSIASRLSPKPIRTFAIGMDTDAIDLKYARRAAEYLGAEHTEVVMTRDEVLATLTRYNEFCAAGSDDDFGKDPHYLAPYDQPPFYAGPAETCRYLYTHGGLDTDLQAQVQGIDGVPIAGLYAAGMCTGGHLGTDTISGNWQLDAVVFGRVAGANAAAAAC